MNHELFHKMVKLGVFVSIWHFRANQPVNIGGRMWLIHFAHDQQKMRVW